MLKRQHLVQLDRDADAAAEDEQEKEKKKKQKKAEYVPVADTDHRHEFAAESFDEETKSWSKKCACGMQVHFEKW